ncbi:hypothetical protein [Comamonas sp.]|uniref:hypothetical protein n=1 Tax=Comamonas sp. TaxID=34028 RepID=UPI002587ECAC|nr:hypothetical protein [Comamonas sp.]
MTNAIDTADLGTLLEMEGTLAERPTVRYLPVGTNGDSQPVLCLKLHNVGPHGLQRFTCNQVFATGKHAAAQARASQLKPGMRLKVQVALQFMECHFPATAHIHTVPAPSAKETTHA